MSPSAEFLIFRESRRTLHVRGAVSCLQDAVGRVPARATVDDLLSPMLLAGELECGLCDAGADEPTLVAVMRLTDLLAEGAIRADSFRHCDGRQLASQAEPWLTSRQYEGAITCSPPEGFAHYALHPLDYADLVSRLTPRSRRALVVGVRSIGTTLSAVVAAKLRSLGVTAERMTVRPAGHPYDRVCSFDPAQGECIASARATPADFLVCDEGPGRSGSSLLSVAEALEREGVPASQIRVLCSHQPDTKDLCARDAAARWSRFQSCASGMTQRLPPDAQCYRGSGEWRRQLLGNGARWPAVWPQMERLKYASADGRTLLTFEGYGPYGEPVANRNEALSDSGYGLRYLGYECGFGGQSIPELSKHGALDLSPQLLARLAEYCAWRAAEFCVAEPDSAPLESSTRFNFEREFAFRLHGYSLPIQRPTICDGRMQPQFWLPTANGTCLKLDGALNGDDHFFPGPCDIAWDLAGVIVEWKLSRMARESFLACYERRSGDRAQPRIRAYELAYATLRMAWSAMAAVSACGSDEEPRLVADYRRYRAFLTDLQRDSRRTEERVTVPVKTGEGLTDYRV